MLTHLYIKVPTLKFMLIPRIYFVRVNIKVESFNNFSVQINLDIDEDKIAFVGSTNIFF